MANHRVYLTLPETELTKADASFQIERDGKLIGTLHISHGALEYQPNGRMKKNSIKIDWVNFDKLLREYEQ